MVVMALNVDISVFSWLNIFYTPFFENFDHATATGPNHRGDQEGKEPEEDLNRQRYDGQRL